MRGCRRPVCRRRRPLDRAGRSRRRCTARPVIVPLRTFSAGPARPRRHPLASQREARCHAAPRLTGFLRDASIGRSKAFREQGIDVTPAGEVRGGPKDLVPPGVGSGYEMCRGAGQPDGERTTQVWAQAVQPPECRPGRCRSAGLVDPLIDGPTDVEGLRRRGWFIWTAAVATQPAAGAVSVGGPAAGRDAAEPVHRQPGVSSRGAANRC
jgi:hypothetical protein